MKNETQNTLTKEQADKHNAKLAAKMVALANCKSNETLADVIRGINKKEATDFTCFIIETLLPVYEKRVSEKTFIAFCDELCAAA